MALKQLPALTPHRSVDRPLSAMEYYFTSIGRSASSLEGDCEVITVLEGEGRLSRAEWQSALAKVVEANPACRVRVVGKRRHARWRSDGEPTRLRFIDDCNWDGRSAVGADFIKAAPLDLHSGPLNELIIVAGDPDRIIIRTHHAVMDGMGTIYFLHELFRALRGEPLQGTNAVFSDTDLKLSVPSVAAPAPRGKPASLTGGFRPAPAGNVWHRITAQGVNPYFILGKLVIWIREFTQRYSDLPVRILLPINLRRHCKGLDSMMNFTGLLIVELGPEDRANDFLRSLRQLLKNNADAYHEPATDLFRFLPMTWVDWLGARFARRENTNDTIGISNFGVLDLKPMNCEGFTAKTIFALPAFDGNAFIGLLMSKDTAEFSVGMPEGLASDGRFDAFISFLEERLGQK